MGLPYELYLWFLITVETNLVLCKGDSVIPVWVLCSGTYERSRYWSQALKYCELILPASRECEESNKLVLFYISWGLKAYRVMFLSFSLYKDKTGIPTNTNYGIETNRVFYKQLADVSHYHLFLWDTLTSWMSARNSAQWRANCLGGSWSVWNINFLTWWGEWAYQGQCPARPAAYGESSAGGRCGDQRPPCALGIVTKGL